jgi:hypothetical protein
MNRFVWSSWPGSSPSKTGVNALMSRPSTFRFPKCREEGVDGRDKPGHDDVERLSPKPALIVLVVGFLIHFITPSLALDTIRLGKAVPNSFAFGAAEVGIDAKIFEREGLDLAVSSFRGDAQLQQALAAGSLDVGLGSGPGLGFRVKGAPMIGVAAMYGAPRNLALLVCASVSPPADRSLIGWSANSPGSRAGAPTAS